jgi:RNA polymerase sigma-70 factor (sigma-E family)
VTGDDERLLLELYLARYGRFVTLATALCGSSAAAEDVVQETYVRLFARPRRLRDPEAAEAYLRTVVVNLSRRHHRHKGAGEVSVVPDLLDARAREDNDPATGVQRRHDLVVALGRLPRRQREVVSLRYLLDLTEQQTAQALGITVGTVKSTTSRGLAALAARLETDHA